MKIAYVIRGAPASGKSTITEAFIKTLPGKVALLELDKFRWGFHTWNREVGDVTEADHAFAYRHFLSSLEMYCKSSEYTLVIEGLFSWDASGPQGNMQDIMAILKKYGFAYHLFLFYGDEETLWRRSSQRPHVVSKEEFRELYGYVMEKRSEEEVSIDVGTQTVEEILRTLATYAGKQDV